MAQAAAMGGGEGGGLRTWHPSRATQKNPLSSRDPGRAAQKDAGRAGGNSCQTLVHSSSGPGHARRPGD
jgi:hypothetical protein